MSKPDRGVVMLQGKAYKTVALRMSEFRTHFPISEGWGVVTSIVSITDQAVLFRAEVRNPDGAAVGVGHASGSIRGSKALEKCETTAVGRALAAIGLTGEEYASADEIAAWVEDRERPTPPPKVEAPAAPYRWPDADRKSFCAALTKAGIAYDDAASFAESKGWGRPSGWSRPKLDRFAEKISEGGLREEFDAFLNVGE